jgi:opacity protein-like surface antigen
MGFLTLGNAAMKGKHILLGCALAADKTGRGYVGVGYTMLTYSEDGFPDFDISALGVRGGYYFNNYFSVEGRFGFGVGDDTQTVSVFLPGIGTFTGDATVELDNMFGVYAVGHIPLTKQFQLYGLVGLTQGEITASVNGFSVSEDDSDLSFGVGAEFDMTPNMSLGIEYTSYITEDAYDVDGLGISFNYIF